jgi:RND family efflux transporter MFP subunit
MPALSRSAEGPCALRLLAAALLAAACSPAAAPERVAEAAAEARIAISVRTVAARRGAVERRIRVAASLEARRESRIGPEVQGTIRRVFVDEGDRVEAGAPLFEIDREPYALALHQAEAALEVARAQRIQGEADLARARALESKQVLALQAIEKLETSLAVARAAEKQAAEAAALARYRAGQTLVRAPYAASVVARLADEGTTALVQPQTTVLVLQETDELEARAAVAESHRAHVRVGDPARVRVEGADPPLETTVTSVSDAVDPTTRTYAVRLRVPNPDRSLKAGAFAEVEIFPAADAESIVVPREAIRSEDGRTRVFTVRDGLAAPLAVELGAVSEQEAEVLRGLEPGVPVIVGDATQEVAPGMPVRVLETGGGA